MRPKVYEAALLAGLRPDPQEPISAWADHHMVLSAEASEQGRFRSSRAPFMREIMDCLSPSSPIREVVFMKCVQITGTTAGLCWVAHTIHRAPTNMLVVEPTVDLAKKISKQRIAPMLEEVDVLRGKVSDPRSRDTSNTMFEKEFPGGRLVLTGANSGVGLRFMSVKNLMLDEVDAYPYDVDGEGPPIDIVEKRTATYPRYKIFKLSTPLLEATSVIEPEYQSSDQRAYHVPCPHCDHGQPLTWAGLTWPKGKPQEAAYLCEQCQQRIPEHYKTQMLEQGQWIPKVELKAWKALQSYKAGFHLNILYQPYGWRYTWPYLAREWTKINERKDTGKLQQFVNLMLAETWEEESGERVQHSELWNRREIYPAPVPNGVIALTASVDVQDDRLEAECVGWGVGEECWAIEKQIFFGGPGSKRSPNVWDQLDRWLQEPFARHDGKTLVIQCTCVDTGYLPNEVYAFVKPRQGRRVHAVKGSSLPGRPILASRSNENLMRVWLFSLGTDTAKDAIFSRLKLQDPGPGYIHFPANPSYDEEHFAQLCAEVKMTKKHRGIVVGYQYKKTRHRNEALDLMVMNLAALAILNPRLNAGEAKEPGPLPDLDPEPKGQWLQERKGWLRR